MPQTTKESRPDVLSATSLIGDRVTNPAGEYLGKIEELMIDLDSGRVAYAVLSFGGFLGTGLGDKLFALPFQALKLDAEHECFVLDVDPEKLRKAPGFDKDHWPSTADRTWGSQIHSYYGCRPYWE